MEVHFTPEQEAQILRIASRTGADPARIVKDAALRLFDDEKPAPPPAPELPVLHLGAMNSLSRRDIYDDVA